MMQAAALSHSVSIPLSIPFSFSQAACSLASRIYQLTLTHFSFLQNLFMVVFGLKEVTFDFPFQYVSLKKQGKSGSFHLIDQAAGNSLRSLQQIKAINTEFSLVHGILYFGSGTYGALEAMHHLQWVNLGQALPFAGGLAAGLFLYTNIYSLEQNIKLFIHASSLGRNPQHHSLAQKIKTSAVLGMVNNIGYILATIAFCFPAAEIPFMALTFFAIFFGSLKILYDFFFVAGPLEKAAK